MSKILFSFLFLSSAASFARTTVTLSPGSEVLVDAGDPTTVRCSGSSSSQGAICECYNNGTFRGEAVGQSGHTEECQRIDSLSAPRSCRPFEGIAICGCYNNGTFRGEVVGSSNLVKACKDIDSLSAPRNCRSF